MLLNLDAPDYIAANEVSTLGLLTTSSSNFEVPAYYLAQSFWGGTAHSSSVRCCSSIPKELLEHMVLGC